MPPTTPNTPEQQLSRERLEALRAMHRLESKAITAITNAERQHRQQIERLEAVIATHRKDIDAAAQELADAVQAGIEQLGSRTRLAEVLGMSQKDLAVILKSRREDETAKVVQPRERRAVPRVVGDAA